MDFGVFLRELRRRYRGRRLLLLLDADSSHTAAALQHLAKMLQIELLWLSKRCPELNPMEHLWRYAKQRVCANRQYPTIDSQLERFLQHVYSLENHEALKNAGVLSKRFWLRSALSRYFCGPT